MNISYEDEAELPDFHREGVYLYEMDGVELNLALSAKVILTKHNNQPGVLLILLSALASRNINIVDMRLGKKGKTGYSALAVEGDPNVIRNLLNKLGPQYHEASLVLFHSM
ncbi:MAG: hypothetical protein U5K51_15275 [Flavobacteriaceae bacterium]|nr:hypothetical protein [Flavobacteriaceae bacterium]